MKDLKIFAKTVDDKAKAQIDLLLEQKAFSHCKVRIMPDVHAGAGCVIGFTANLGDKVIPNIVGVDIGCGMYCCPIGTVEIDYGELDKFIRTKIPSGMNVHDRPREFFDINGLYCYDRLRNKEWLEASLGTLGGGNHFIEVDEDEEGYKYLVIHTGSRNLGKQVADIYQQIAIETLNSNKADIQALIDKLKAEGRHAEIADAIAEVEKTKKDVPPNDLCYLEGEDREKYLHDMRLCQQFAIRNRERIAEDICNYMHFSPLEPFHTVHNYIDDDNIVRKGAISAHYQEPLLIPINMRDGCILGFGKGNEDWNFSAPHGAGRIMSRMEAKRKITLESYEDAMSGIFTTSVGFDTLDEAPQAYKPMEEIVECIKDTVEIFSIIKPVYNFKAAD